MSAKTHLMIVTMQKNKKNSAYTSGEWSLMSAFQVLAPPLHPEREKFEKQSLSQLGVYTKNFEKSGYVFFTIFRIIFGKYKYSNCTVSSCLIIQKLEFHFYKFNFYFVTYVFYFFLSYYIFERQ